MIENPSKLGTINFAKKDGAFSLSKTNRPINALAPRTSGASLYCETAVSLLNSLGFVKAKGYQVG